MPALGTGSLRSGDSLLYSTIYSALKWRTLARHDWKMKSLQKALRLLVVEEGDYDDAP
jgi:hypothetical protein